MDDQPVAQVEEKQEEQSIGPINYTPEAFFEEYKALCDKTGYQLIVTPVLAPTNHGTFEIAQSVSVGKLPPKN